MTEEDARGWVVDRYGERAAERIDAFHAMVCEENLRQNLIAPSTVPMIWARHGLDSAQLVPMGAGAGGSWLDVGTGGGFPGIIVALLFGGPVTMVEPRRRRVEFLQSCIGQLGLDGAVVLGSKVEQVSGAFQIISARAVASVEKLLQAAAHCATPTTRWILPRGRIEPDQLALLRRDRSRVFHVEHSLTDPTSSILIVEPVR